MNDVTSAQPYIQQLDWTAGEIVFVFGWAPVTQFVNHNVNVGGGIWNKERGRLREDTFHLFPTGKGGLLIVISLKYGMYRKNTC